MPTFDGRSPQHFRAVSPEPSGYDEIEAYPQLSFPATVQTYSVPVVSMSLAYLHMLLSIGRTREDLSLGKCRSIFTIFFVIETEDGRLSLSACLYLFPSIWTAYDPFGFSQPCES
jgi:hypothetical protein